MTIEAALREALAGARRGAVRFARDFQGFPGTVHGGAVGALFHRLTVPRPPAALELALRRGVPTETSLDLSTGSVGRAARLSLTLEGRVLAEATVTRAVVPPPDPAPVLTAWAAGPRREVQELPGTATCLACGAANPLGLQVRFLHDGRFLWREYLPRSAYRAPDGAAHPALAVLMLDELGWWLGALEQGECGVTTEVRVVLYRSLPFGPLCVLGDRQAVRPGDDPRGRYCQAEGFLLTAEGALLAHGRVTFAGSRAYTRRLLQPFLETTAPEVLFRLFPRARDLAFPGRPGAADRG